jgi:hypothetical protein
MQLLAHLSSAQASSLPIRLDISYNIVVIPRHSLDQAVDTFRHASPDIYAMTAFLYKSIGPMVGFVKVLRAT